MTHRYSGDARVYCVFIGGCLFVVNTEKRLSLVDELIMLIMLIYNRGKTQTPKPRNPEPRILS